MRRLSLDSPARPARSADSPVRVSTSWFAWISSRPSILAIALFLAGLVLYLPALTQGFIWYDDPIYVTENSHVATGLTTANLAWAITSLYAANWHPVTWWSHMLDCQLFGLSPWGHQLTNSLLHGLNMVVVFVALRRLTGATWRSFAVALLFGVHPLQVQSVAWISERKNLLSTLFWMLSLWAYAEYAFCRRRREILDCGGKRSATPLLTPSESGVALRLPPQSKRVCYQASKLYCLGLICCCLGLMAKPMLVTAPFLLLVLDWWPLVRLERRRLPPLLAEKIPFLLAALVSAVLTSIAQKQGGALQSTLPLIGRVENAAVGYCRYLTKLFLPVDLAVFYPPVPDWPTLVVAGALLMLLLISVGVLLTRRQQPAVLAGWLWFLGTLVPVIGLVQAGDQSLADRYFYVPGIGLLIMLVWGAAAFLQRWPRPAQAGAAICGVVAGLLFAVTHWQLGFWRDTETLFSRAIVVTKNNYLAHDILGVALEKRGLLDQAIVQFNKSLRERPNYAEAHNSLGLTLEKAGQPEQAISHYREAIALRPEFTDPHFNLAVALGTAGRVEESAAEYEIVLKLDPSAADAHNNLGFLFDKRGALDQAILHYRQAIRLKPNYARAHFNLGVALTRQAKLDEAISEFEIALQLKPDYAEARFNLAAVREARKERPGP